MHLNSLIGKLIKVNTYFLEIPHIVDVIQKKIELQRAQPLPPCKTRTKAYYCERMAARNAMKKLAMPIWANKFLIKKFYALAELRTKKSGFSWHVDHIVPLKSKLVCGLHAYTNLQVIPAIKNLKKHNSFWPDMPIAVHQGSDGGH